MKEGMLIAKAIKKNRVTFLQNHGVIVCGNEISHTFDDLYYLERCCYVQNIAQSAGKKLINLNNKQLQGYLVKLKGRDFNQNYILKL